MTGLPPDRAASISWRMRASASHAIVPLELRNRFIDSRIGSGRSPQNA
jgi:hypothetical protein